MDDAVVTPKPQRAKSRQAVSENRQNVDALVMLLREAPFNSPRGTAAIAEFLASRGVLVPSVLSDEDCRDLPAFYPETSIEEPSVVWAQMRQALGAIAKGETR